jgi:hypothetical protein
VACPARTPFLCKAVENDPNRLKAEIALKIGSGVVSYRTGFRTLRARLFEALEHMWRSVRFGASLPCTHWSSVATRSRNKKKSLLVRKRPDSGEAQEILWVTLVMFADRLLGESRVMRRDWVQHAEPQAFR